MPKLIDIAGNRYGRLIVLKHVYGEDWKCRCDCGRDIVVRSSHLRGGYKKSCGCLRSPHGESYRRTPEYTSWCQLRDRCFNPNNKKWKHYGGRGIKVCERWQHFENFLADMGRRPPGRI